MYPVHEADMYHRLTAVLLSCGGEQKEKDLTNGDQENISPNQQISPDEAAPKDSTSSDFIEKDSVRQD